MECNKDEAVRARQIAEARMQRGEFVEALRFATKAKKLYSEVENITQIFTICEVHNAAQKKVSASEMDWYAILQIERLADEATIKKQYRRLALLLHPDKNKFAGAEAAFKLIGQANGVLSDQAKRSLYDNKFGASVRGVAPQSSCRYSNVNVSAAKHDANATNCKKKFDSQHYSNVNVSAAKHDANATNCQKKFDSQHYSSANVSAAKHDANATNCKKKFDSQHYSNVNVSAAKHDANATNCQKKFDSHHYSNVNVSAAKHDANATNCQKKFDSHHYSNVKMSAAKHDANATNCQKKFDSQHYSNVNVSAAKHDANATNYQKDSYRKSTCSNKQAKQKTFWTSCQHCNTKYHYCIAFVNATLRCQKCFKSFKARVQKEASMHGSSKPVSESTGGNPVYMKKCAAGVDGHRKGEKGKYGCVSASKDMESQTSKKVGSKRVKQSASDSGKNFKAKHGDEMKDAYVRENDVDPSKVNARRSSRIKQREDSEIPSKKPRQN